MPTDLDLRVSRELGPASGWLIALGAILLIGGVMLIAAPVVGGLVVTSWVAAIFIVAGIVQLVHAVRASGWRSGVWQGLSGLVYLVGGLLALFNPLAGAVAITVVLAVTFIIDGVVRILLALTVRPLDHWGWVLMGGIVALVVGLYLLVVIGSAPASLVILGTFAGISFIFEGAAFLRLGLSSRRTG